MAKRRIPPPKPSLPSTEELPKGVAAVFEAVESGDSKRTRAAFEALSAEPGLFREFIGILAWKSDAGEQALRAFAKDAAGRRMAEAIRRKRLDELPPEAAAMAKADWRSMHDLLRELAAWWRACCWCGCGKRCFRWPDFCWYRRCGCCSLLVGGAPDGSPNPRSTRQLNFSSRFLVTAGPSPEQTGVDLAAQPLPSLEAVAGIASAPATGDIIVRGVGQWQFQPLPPAPTLESVAGIAPGSAAPGDAIVRGPAGWQLQPFPAPQTFEGMAGIAPGTTQPGDVVVKTTAGWAPQPLSIQSIAGVTPQAGDTLEWNGTAWVSKRPVRLFAGKISNASGTFLHVPDPVNVTWLSASTVVVATAVDAGGLPVFVEAQFVSSTQLRFSLRLSDGSDYSGSAQVSYVIV